MSARAAHKNWKSAVRVLNVVIGLVVLGAWFVNFAPQYIGGPATYAIVDGVSMEPEYHTGDLVIAKSESSYAIGDLIVYANKTGYIIHRIVAGNSTGGWKTQGDHNTWIDGWVVKDNQILGQVHFGIGQVGTWFNWVIAHPWQFATIAALLALIPYLPLRRRHLSPALVQALRFSQKDAAAPGRTKADYIVMYISLFSTVLTLGVVAFMYSKQTLFTIPGFVILTGLWAMGLFTYFFIHRMYDGWGVTEPAKSLFALSGMTHSVDLFPHLEGKVYATQSAIELRNIAEKYRLPILHHFDAASHQHAYLVITQSHGSFFWIPLVPDQWHEVIGHSVDRIGSDIRLLEV
jgi:signal peptidase I